ncbi:MAG: efflux RND transporter periplasmic adaptor subunit [Pseudomonadota bacterium]
MKSRSIQSKIFGLSAPLVVLAIGIAIAAYFISSRPKARPRDLSEVAQAVSVVGAEIATATPEIKNFGEVIASREAEMRAMVAGRLVFLSEQLQDGAIITEGTKIAEVDPFIYQQALEQAQANLAEAEARLGELKSDVQTTQRLLEISNEQLKLRERDRKRSADLIKKGQTSKKALDDAEIALNLAAESKAQRRQSLLRAQAQLKQQNASISRLSAALAQAERNLSDTVITAPFDGYLADTGAALGKWLGVGESIGRLIAKDELQVRFQLNNDDYARLISQGTSDALFSREVQVNWQLGDNEFQYSGQVERSAAEIDPASGGVLVYARVASEEHNSNHANALRPGAFVEISLADISYPDVVKLPEEAVVDGHLVFVVEDNQLTGIDVDVVRRVGAEVLVRGDIKASDFVVTTPFPNIGPGVRVRVTE